MFHKRETRTAAMRRWKTGRDGPRWGAGFRGPDTFAEDLALFEQQVRDEAGQRNGPRTRPAPSVPPATTAA